MSHQENNQYKTHPNSQGHHIRSENTMKKENPLKQSVDKLYACHVSELSENGLRCLLRISVTEFHTMKATYRKRYGNDSKREFRLFLFRWVNDVYGQLNPTIAELPVTARIRLLVLQLRLRRYQIENLNPDLKSAWIYNALYPGIERYASQIEQSLIK